MEPNRLTLLFKSFFEYPQYCLGTLNFREAFFAFFYKSPANIQLDNSIITFDTDLLETCGFLHCIERTKLNERDGGQIQDRSTVNGWKSGPKWAVCSFSKFSIQLFLLKMQYLLSSASDCFQNHTSCVFLCPQHYPIRKWCKIQSRNFHVFHGRSLVER